MLKDVLKDIVLYTNGINTVDVVKIIGTDVKTEIITLSIGSNGHAVVLGKTKNPVSEFNGIFGITNLNKIKMILGFEEYSENERIHIKRETVNDESVPISINFENQSGDFLNEVRLMSKNLVEEKISSNVSFKGAEWDVEFVPQLANVQKFKRQASVNNEENQFTVKQDGKNLKFNFGSATNSSGAFIFNMNTTGTLRKPLKFPVKYFVTIMDLPGEKSINISNSGVMKITVDSGISIYDYYLLSFSV